METNEFLDQGLNTSSNQGLSPEDRDYLETAAKWAKFLGIMGFIFTALIVLGAFSVMTIGSSFGSAMPPGSPFAGGMFGVGLGIFYLVLALPYFFISLYMYNFAEKTKAGLYSSNSEIMTLAYKNLRNYFRLSGILILAMIVIYILIIIFGIGAMTMMSR